ncbi:hypothetical protein [Ralstonia pseudosolanacearum]|uniref:hypothetical protein n=1 Tax=Ralstonia pseudosolanacearum TaxID=1310165 RepID=UPI0040539364
MSLPQDQTSPNRARWITITMVAGWLAFGVVAVIGALCLSRQDETARAQAHQSVQLHEFTGRLSALEQQIETNKRLPPALPQAEFAATRQALEARLTQIEQAQPGFASTTELEGLRTRVNALETNQTKATQANATAAHPPAPRKRSKPEALEPPFHVIGVELRGGVRFLSVRPHGSAALGDVHLLREGGAEGTWLLQSIDAHVAQFRVHGQPQHVPLP